MIIATSSPKKWKIGAELIKWYQKTDFSHVLIIHDSLVYQASHGSVNVQHIDVFLKDNNIIANYEVSNSLVDLNFVKLQLGKKYGKIQLIKIALNFLFGLTFKDNGNERFICSEFVGKALKLEWVNDLTTPIEIHEFIRGKKT